MNNKTSISEDQFAFELMKLSKPGIDSASDYLPRILQELESCETLNEHALQGLAPEDNAGTPTRDLGGPDSDGQRSSPCSAGGNGSAVPALDVLSGSFLQLAANYVARSSGLAIAILITSKNGTVVQSAQSGWDASDFRIQSRTLAKIAKESVWRKEPRFSSDALACVQNSGEDKPEPSDSTIDLSDGMATASVPPEATATATVPTVEASVCLNELSQIIGTSLCSIPYALTESTGYAVFLCQASPIRDMGVASYFAQASHLWLGKVSVVNLLKQLDTWLIIRRCSWFAKVVGVTESIRSNSRWWLFPCGLVCAAMFLPIPYYPRRDCVFEPETKQYLSSPIQGRIASCEVRPGDSVEKGQLMARIDDDQLRRDLATAKAEHDSAIKKRDSALATRATGNIALADIEMEQAERRIQSIQDQLRRLEIRATSAGVVVQGDWQRNVGMPLTLGQSLFEVAELESMTAEVRLLASDLAQINVGDEVSIRSDASGIASFRGKISRIEPRATVIDDAAVFVADVIIHDPKLQLRPGMKAKAQIEAGWRSIGWYLFNRPYTWIANQWIW